MGFGKPVLSELLPGDVYRSFVGAGKPRPVVVVSQPLSRARMADLVSAVGYVIGADCNLMTASGPKSDLG